MLYLAATERMIPRCRSEQTWVQSLAVVASDAPWLHTTRTQPWWSTCPTPSPSYATWRAGSGTTPAHTSTALHAYLTVRRGAGDRKAEDAAGDKREWTGEKGACSNNFHMSAWSAYRLISTLGENPPNLCCRFRENMNLGPIPTALCGSGSN